MDAAAASYRRAIAIHPGFAETHDNLGGVLRDQGRLDEAAASCRRAIALNPDLAKAHLNLGNVLTDQVKLDEALVCYDQALSLEPDFIEAHSNRLFSLHYRSGHSAQALLAEHRRWDERHGGGGLASRPSFANVRDPERRLRIGYVSGDFRRHSVSYFLESVLAAHDRSVVEVFCYSNNAINDEVTARLRASADHWRGIVGVSDDDAAAMIERDGVDILVDLSGHTAKNRLTLFARKPAPVQATWLGYPNTTGLAAMDYRIVDPITDPDAIADGWASEALVRLEGGFLCYAPPGDAPPVVKPPSLASGVVTFASFNNPTCCRDQTVETWAAVLHRVAGSRLLLKGKPFADEGARSLLETRFAAHGSDPGRLILTSLTGSLGAHLEAAMAKVDIGLDPFPYNGTTTTCEALWMGAPVVSLIGERHAGRVGASLLARVGLEALIASDRGQYVEIAAGLAADPARLTDLRKTLRARLQASPLCDAPAFAASLEAAFRAMWRRWCADLPAAPIDVPASPTRQRLGEPASPATASPPSPQ